MPARERHAPGSFCYPEVSVPDVARAAAFYGPILGWEIGPVPGGGYHLARRGGRVVAGVHAPPGVPANWLCYVRVDSADAAAAKAAGLGARVRHAPFDIPGIGRMAMLQDPADALFALWEPKGMDGVGLVDEPGAPCWWELLTRDADAARAFYAGLFGWKPQPMPLSSAGMAYTLFRNGSDPAGGMMPLPRGPLGDAPPHWCPYFAVEDCDGAAALCAGKGGRVVQPPRDLPLVGRFAVLADPDGARFAVIRAGA